MGADLGLDLRFLLLAAVLAVAGCDDPPPPLEADIGWLAGELWVENASPSDWQACLLILNDDFKAEMPVIGAGARASHWLASFVDDYGRRFDLVYRRPQSLYLRCDRAPDDSRWISIGFPG